ncbi:MAG: hypothetical protein RR140_02990 [Clostridia bacterium]
MKKALIIIAYVLVGIFVVSVITLSCITKSNFPVLANPNYITIKNSQSERNFGAETEDFKEAKTLLENSFKENFLASIFTSEKLKWNTGTLVSDTEILALPISMILKFNSKQTLKNGNKIVYQETNTALAVEYDQVIFSLTETAGRQKVNLFFLSEIVKNQQTSKIVYRITTYGDTKPLYDFVTNKLV